MVQPILRNAVRAKKLLDPGCVPHNLVERSYTLFPATLIVLQTFAPNKGMLNAIWESMREL
jgi:hypothetical protein